MAGIKLSLFAEVGGLVTVSKGASVEYMELPDEPVALLSLFNLPRRLKIVLPKICTLSGRSRDGMLLDVER